MEIKGLLFDLDGVIVDTAQYHFLAWRKLANELGFDFNETQNEQLKGISRRGSIEKILAWGGINLPDDEISRYMILKNSWYLEHIDGMKPDQELPGAGAFLRSCKAEGYNIALGSSSKNARHILEKLELISVFDAIIDGTKVSASKPDPEVFLKGAKALNLPPEACVVFEDAIAGIQAAHNAGMKAIGIGDASTLTEADTVYRGLIDINPAHFLADLN